MEDFILIVVCQEQKDKELAYQLAIRGYLSLFVMDSNGKTLDATVGYHDPKALLKLGFMQ